MEKKTIYALFSNALELGRKLLVVGEKAEIIKYIKSVQGYSFTGDPEEIIPDNPKDLDSTFPLEIGNDFLSPIGSCLEIEKVPLL